MATIDRSPASASSFGEVSAILDRKCTACHNIDGAAGAADLNLEAEAAYAMLMRRSTEAPLPLVTPGNPQASYFFAKITGQQALVGGWGDRMPAGQESLAASEIEAIRKWIVSGAKR